MKTFHCGICEQTLKGTRYHFRNHLYTHFGKPKYKCTVCSKEFKRPDALSRHLKTHNGTLKTYYCDHCDKKFVDKRNLVYHLRTHNCFKDRFLRFSCKACGLDFCEQRLLDYHKQKQHYKFHGKTSIHLEKSPNETWFEKVHNTDACVKITKINNNVLTIQKCGKVECVEEKSTIFFSGKVSSNYEKVICDYCKKEMLKKSLLKHIREAHLKLKSFRCKRCNLGFSRHYILLKHSCEKRRQKKN